MMIGAPRSFSYLISSLSCVIPPTVMFVGLRGDALSSERWSRFRCVPADDNNHDPDEVLRVPGYPTTPPDVIHIQQIYEVSKKVAYLLHTRMLKSHVTIRWLMDSPVDFHSTHTLGHAHPLLWSLGQVRITLSKISTRNISNLVVHMLWASLILSPSSTRCL